MRLHKLKLMILFWCLICLININCLTSHKDKGVKFLQDFFENRNTRISISCCWKNNDIMIFLKTNMKSTKPKQTGVYKSITENNMNLFFSDLSTENWFVMDFINCNDYEILSKINERKLFRYPLKYLFLTDTTKYTTLLTNLNPLSILPMSEVVIATFGQSIHLYQPYKINEKDSLLIENYGIWSEITGMKLYYDSNSFAERRRNFRMRQITLSVVVNKIENTRIPNFDDFPESKADEPYFFHDFANTNNLIQYLNATYALRIFNSYGYLNHTTGKFDGMAEDIYEERSDLTGTYLILSEDRHRIMEFLKPADNFAVRARFILKKPAMSYIENIYYVTFTYKVWVASLVILGGMAVSLYILLNWEVKKLNNNHRHAKYTVSDITLLSLEAVCQQGTVIDSSTYSGRTIIFILFTAFMFLYVAYSAYILVLLQSTKPITSIRHLVDSRIECGGLNISYMMAYYESTKDEALKDLYKKKIYPNRFYSLEHGLNKVQEGNFAFQVILGPAYNYILKKYINYDICKLQELPGYMDTLMSPAVPKTSQYKKLFKIGFILGVERGLEHRIRNRVSMRPTCYNEAGNFQSVRIYDCHSVFILYAVGTLLALAVFCGETLISKYSMKNK